MEKIQLSLFCKIIGIGSASGLFYQNNLITVISDNSSYLYQYETTTQKLHRIPLNENPQENIPKKEKPDFESLAHYGDTLYIFGSGSTDKRTVMVTFDNLHKKVTRVSDLQNLYSSMQSFGEIKPDDFNLEGCLYDGATWYFLNRGNGKNQQNTVFSVESSNLEESFRIITNSYKLPKIKGVRTSFTDAVMVNGKIYFLATAENTTSTYHDGEVLGSIVGCINPDTMKIEFTRKISETQKFEGITYFSSDADYFQFLLCEDADNEKLESNIYLLKLLK